MYTRPVLFALVGCMVGVGVAWATLRPATQGDSARPIPPADAGAQAAEILAGSDPMRRIADLGALLSRVEPQGLPALREAYETSALDGGDVELILLAQWWAGFDPEGALRWTATDWRAGHGNVIASVFRAWAHSDPRAALERAHQLRFPVQREMGVRAALAGWDESGAPGLVEFVQALPDETQRQLASMVLARRRVASLGSAGALRWAQELPDDGTGFKGSLERRVASAVAEMDPPAAAAWAESRLGGDRPSGLPRRIGTRWVRRDPEAAMAWLASLPGGADRDDGVTESFRDWRSLDPEAAGAWIGATELERWNEPAFAVYARSIASESPREALELVSRFSDESMRDSTATVIARAWLTADREAADAWLRESDLSEEVRKRAYMIRQDVRRQQRARQRQHQQSPGAEGSGG